MLTTINDQIGKKYAPRAVLVVYSDCSPGSYNASFYLETRPVKGDGTLGPAKPASRKLLQEIAETILYRDKTIPHGAVPANLLSADPTFGKERFIWWTPPGKKTLFFSKGTGMPDGKYHMPGCVFLAQGSTLYVFSFKGKKPGKETRLLYGPFYNYYESGRICLGNARMDKPANCTWTDIQAYWEKIFWMSENSHMMTNPMKKGFNLNTAIKEASESPFDTDKLNETKLTLGQLLDGRSLEN